MSKSKREEFIAYLEAQVGSSLYVWGGQGETVKGIIKRWVQSKETSASNVSRVMALFDKLMPKDFTFYDCSGLGTVWLLANRLISSDMTANGLYHLCRPVTSDKVQPGDFVFRVNVSDVATHIGYVVDSNRNVIECQGRVQGVVKRPLSQGGWNRYGCPETLFGTHTDAEGGTGTTTTGSKGICRVLKLTDKPRMSGDDVRWLQEALILFGVPLDGGIDGVFGPGTERAVLQAQQELFPETPKEWDGKAGKKTAEALNLKWMN